MTDGGVVERFDHLAIAVPDLREAVVLFLDLFGGTFLAGGDDDGRGIRTLHVKVPPGVKLELMQPTRPDSFLSAHIARRGPGFHHATVFVADLQEAIERLDAGGVELVDTDWSRPGWYETFVRPRSGFGTLLQVVQTDRTWGEVADPTLTVEEVLRGEVVWVDERPLRRRDLDDAHRVRARPG